MLAATDARLASATETLASMVIIKFSSWQGLFARRMQESREKELAVLQLRFAIRTVANVIMQLAPQLCILVSFALYTLYYGRSLTPDVAFPSLALFAMLKSPLQALVEMTAALSSCWVSIQRIQSFLNVPETAKYAQLSQKESKEDPEIGFRKATITHQSLDAAAAYDKAQQDYDEFRLEDISINFRKNALNLIVGPVGSGKSTLLMSLLGETTLLNGSIFMPDDKGDAYSLPRDAQTGLRTNQVAYCSQTPFLISASIRDNIVWGQPFDEQRYKQVLFACALERDLEIFEQGDRTVVGEKGTVASGGQK